MTSGIELAHSFFVTQVQPIMAASFPALGYVAARLGSGSDVLGFDDDMSRDHDFGCRLTLLVDDDALDRVALVDEALERELPNECTGHPTRFATSWDARHRHKVEVASVNGFAASRLGLDPSTELDAVGWLCLTGQSVLEVVGGPVFHDTATTYEPLRQQLAWYPDDVWRYVLGAAWTRLGQELPFVGRAAERGDELGSRVISARLARDLIHLAYLINRVWSPYPKWAGTVLAQLPDGPDLIVALGKATGADDWRLREDALCETMSLLGAAHRRAGFAVEEPLTHFFFDRPFRIPDAAIAEAIRDGITDPEVRALPAGIGSVEQWCDNVDMLSHVGRRTKVKTVYRQLIDGVTE